MTNKNSTKLLSIILTTFISLISVMVFIIRVIIGFDFYTCAINGFNGEYLKYFTSLSNFYSGIVFTIILIYLLKHYKEDNVIIPKYLKILTLSAVVGVTVTFLVTIFFLNFSISTPWILYEYEILFFHIINPIVSIIYYIFFLKGEKLKFYQLLFGALPLFIYSIFYSVFVLSGVWKDFYNFTFGGNYWVFFIAFPSVILIGLGVSILLNLFNKKVHKE